MSEWNGKGGFSTDFQKNSFHFGELASEHHKIFPFLQASEHLSIYQEKPVLSHSVWTLQGGWLRSDTSLFFLSCWIYLLGSCEGNSWPLHTDLFLHSNPGYACAQKTGKGAVKIRHREKMVIKGERIWMYWLKLYWVFWKGKNVDHTISHRLL